MKKLIVLLSILVCGRCMGQTTNAKLSAYFADHRGGACLVPYDIWKSNDTTKVGRDKGLFIVTEDAMEAIVQEAQNRGGGKAFDIAYIDSQLCVKWADTIKLIRFYIPPASLDTLKIRLPEATSPGANADFIQGGRTCSGTNEAFINQVPFDLLAPIPNYFGPNDKYEILSPAKKKNAVESTRKEPANNEVGWGWILVLSPIILFLYLLGMFRKGLKTFDVNGALSENTSENITEVNQKYKDADFKDMLTSAGGANAANMANLATLFPPTLQVTAKDAQGNLLKDFRPSTSRLIAFISGILLLAIAFGMSCFYIYFYLRTNNPPDLANLSGVLVALGLGMAPYAFNKISDAVNTNKQASK
jgi:hypothetical protein